MALFKKLTPEEQDEKHAKDLEAAKLAEEKKLIENYNKEKFEKTAKGIGSLILIIAVVYCYVSCNRSCDRIEEERESEKQQLLELASRYPILDASGKAVIFDLMPLADMDYPDAREHFFWGFNYNRIDFSDPKNLTNYYKVYFKSCEHIHFLVSPPDLFQSLGCIGDAKIFKISFRQIDKNWQPKWEPFMKYPIPIKEFIVDLEKNTVTESE